MGPGDRGRRGKRREEAEIQKADGRRRAEFLGLGTVLVPELSEAKLKCVTGGDRQTKLLDCQVSQVQGF